MMRAFADRLIESVRIHGPLCVGIDPHPDLVPPLFGPPGAKSAASWSLAVVERCRGRVAAVKPQAGLFERWGSRGVEALETVCSAASDAGLIVILDAKRGDIGSTAEGYAQAYLAEASPCPCDCITLNPYMGVDTLEPFLRLAEQGGKGLAILARTSNPGSADFQARLIDGEPLFIHVARALAPAMARLQGEQGWSGLMLVAGATGPGEAVRLRAAAPSALFLVPGYGAQGGAAADAVAGFVPRAGRLEGGIVNASRSATAPPSATGAASAAEWDAAIGTAIAAAGAELCRVVGRG
jgi:orotidine-5'-phosphate decarboxylase